MAKRLKFTILTVSVIFTYASWFLRIVDGRSLEWSMGDVVPDGTVYGNSMRYRRSVTGNDIPSFVDIANMNSMDTLDTDSKYRLIEQTLTMLEQLITSLENLGRKTREEKHKPKMTVGSGLLQQLDHLERMMRRERMSRRLDQLEQVKKKLLDLG